MHIAKDTHGVEVTKVAQLVDKLSGLRRFWPHLRGIWLVDVTLQPRLKSSRGAVYSSSGCCPPPSHCKFSVSPKKFHCWQLQLHRGLCILLLLFSLKNSDQVDAHPNPLILPIRVWIAVLRFGLVSVVPIRLRGLHFETQSRPARLTVRSYAANHSHGSLTSRNVVNNARDDAVENMACTIDEQGFGELGLVTSFHTRQSPHHGGCSIQSLTHTVLSKLHADSQQTVFQLFHEREWVLLGCSIPPEKDLLIHCSYHHHRLLNFLGVWFRRSWTQTCFFRRCLLIKRIEEIPNSSHISFRISTPVNFVLASPRPPYMLYSWWHRYPNSCWKFPSWCECPRIGMFWRRHVRTISSRDSSGVSLWQLRAHPLPAVCGGCLVSPHGSTSASLWPQDL